MTLKTTRAGNQWTLALSGALDERAQGPLIRYPGDLSGCDRLTIDLSGIACMNSIGISIWAAFLESVSARCELELVRCSVGFMDVANLTPLVTAGAQVKSFYVPCHCDHCATDTMILVETSTIRRNAYPRLSCVDCGHVARPVIDADRYLQFLDAV